MFDSCSKRIIANSFFGKTLLIKGSHSVQQLVHTVLYSVDELNSIKMMFLNVLHFSMEGIGHRYVHPMQVLEQDDANVSVLVQRALLYESMEKYKLGAEDLRTVLKIDPGNRVARGTIHRLTQLAD